MMNLTPGIILFNLRICEPINQLLNNLIIVMLATALLCFLVSEITRNYSQVDKLWSLMPLVYSWMVYMEFPSWGAGNESAGTAWGLEPGYNFRKEGWLQYYPWRGEEDYRWKIMQQQPMLRGR
ncbi:MAG: hypothetical protein R2744_09090 [Bacteroidales bacterium]